MRRDGRKRSSSRDHTAELALVIAVVSILGASCSGPRQKETKPAGSAEEGRGATEIGSPVIVGIVDPDLDPFTKASTYRVDAWTNQTGEEVAPLVDLLPRRAKDLLGDPELIAGPGTEMTRTDAREVAEIIDRSGFMLTSIGDGSLGVIEYSGSVNIGFGHGPPRGVSLVIVFHPI